MSSARLPDAEYEVLKHDVFVRDKWKCRACGFREQLHCHHVIFRSAGGPDASWNLATVCSGCHDKIHVHKTLVIVGDNADISGRMRFVRIIPKTT